MTIDGATHRVLAIEANNSTWDFLSKPFGELSATDAEEMTKRAYVAAYHWARAENAGPMNQGRAAWLLSRVWVQQCNGELARKYAEQCLLICEKNGLADFDLAYASEAMARAHACLGNTEEARRWREAAKAVSIADPEDKALVNSDIEVEPWFGI